MEYFLTINIQLTNSTYRHASLNPLTTSTESYSDWAEIFSITSFIYLKNIIFYASIFSHCKKVICDLVFFYFLNLWQCMVQIYVPKQCLGLQPHVSRAHRIFFYVQISFILSEMTSNVAIILRNCENVLLEKMFKVIFSTFLVLRLSLSDPFIGFYSNEKCDYIFLCQKRFCIKITYGY